MRRYGSGELSWVLLELPTPADCWTGGGASEGLASALSLGGVTGVTSCFIFGAVRSPPSSVELSKFESRGSGDNNEMSVDAGALDEGETDRSTRTGMLRPGLELDSRKSSATESVG